MCNCIYFIVFIAHVKGINEKFEILVKNQHAKDSTDIPLCSDRDDLIHLEAELSDRLYYNSLVNSQQRIVFTCIFYGLMYLFKVVKLQERIADNGVDVASQATKLVLSRVLSRELQCRVTLTGEGHGIVFALRNTLLLSLIKDCIMQYFPGTKALSVQNSVQSFLKRSSDRKGGIPRSEKKKLIFFD